MNIVTLLHVHVLVFQRQQEYIMYKVRMPYIIMGQTWVRLATNGTNPYMLAPRAKYTVNSDLKKSRISYIYQSRSLCAQR